MGATSVAWRMSWGSRASDFAARSRATTFAETSMTKPDAPRPRPTWRSDRARRGQGGNTAFREQRVDVARRHPQDGRSLFRSHRLRDGPRAKKRRARGSPEFHLQRRRVGVGRLARMRPEGRHTAGQSRFSVADATTRRGIAGQAAARSIRARGSGARDGDHRLGTGRERRQRRIAFRHGERALGFNGD